MAILGNWKQYIVGYAVNPSLASQAIMSHSLFCGLAHQ